MTTTPTTSPDAVDALANVLAESFPEINIFPVPMAKDFVMRLAKQGFTITRAKPAPLMDEVEKALDEIDGVFCSEAANRLDTVSALRAHISTLETQLTALRHAAEIGLAYVVAAQRGVTFTKPKMAGDIEVINDALKMGGGE